MTQMTENVENGYILKANAIVAQKNNRKSKYNRTNIEN